MPMPAQRPHRSEQRYATPDVFITAVKRRLGIEAFAFDFAAEAHTAKAAQYFTEADDALVQTWPAHLSSRSDVWGWLNPPFTNIAPWAEQCAALRRAKRQVALLVPASVGANWFRDFVDGQALVLALNGRLAFMPERPTWLYPKDCLLCLYSPAIRPGFEVWDWRHTPGHLF